MSRDPLQQRPGDQRSVSPVRKRLQSQAYGPKLMVNASTMRAARMQQTNPQQSKQSVYKVLISKAVSSLPHRAVPSGIPKFNRV